MSMSLLAVAGFMAYSATGAFFSDTETSTGNTFTAGAIDLTVDSQAHYAGLVCTNGTWQDDTAVAGDPTRPDLLNQACGGTWAATDLGPTNQFFNLGDLKPGDTGENTLSLHVSNNDAYVCAIVDNLQDNDNGVTEPEADAGDVTPGPIGEGELSSELHFFAWADTGATPGFQGQQTDPTEGDNIWQAGENPLFSNVEGPASDVLGGVSYPLFTPQTAAMPAGSTAYVGLYWCYGALTVGAPGTLTCNGAPTTNITQTDSMTADISFYVEQSRNNGQFVCPAPGSITPDNGGTTVVNQNDLVTTFGALAGNPDAWFFYNDVNDSIMTIDQFAPNGENHMASVAGAEGAKMLLDNADARYNIATYKYNDVKLSDITTLKYRAYDATSDSDVPYLHFNVDFDNSNTWQRRLVYVPGQAGNPAIPVGAWTEVDAIQGGAAMWTWSGYASNGNKWPDNNVNEYRSWNDIKAAFPNAETRSTDSWLGIRDGQGGPLGATDYVDWFQFNNDKSDFAI